jgi:sodium-coupled neutral amino acid transporter 9
VQYYRTIVNKGNFGNNFLETPTHILDPNLFYIAHLFPRTGSTHSVDQMIKDSPKAPSWMTIISIWNTMIGSTLVSLPWSVRRAGIVPGIGKK